MKFFAKKYLLLMMTLSLAFMPVEHLVTDAAAKGSKKTVKKSSYKSAKSRKARSAKRRSAKKARRLAQKEQLAIDLGKYYDGSSFPHLSSQKVLVVNQSTGEVKYTKNSNAVSPIASITKLMTAMVVLDAGLPFSEVINISDQDIDTIKGTRSRLAVGTSLTRGEMFKLALMSSENRAAFALARNYPGGRAAFAKAMNAKALLLGLTNTYFAEPTGLMYQNTSTAEDLYKLTSAAHQYPEIRQATTTQEYDLYLEGRNKPLKYKNTNKLVRDGEWDIGLSKTGFINEAGRCLVMQVTMGGEPIIVVLLDAAGTNKRTGDANRVRKWVEYNRANTAASASNDVQTDVEQKLVMSKRIWKYGYIESRMRSIKR